MPSDVKEVEGSTGESETALTNDITSNELIQRRKVDEVTSTLMNERRESRKGAITENINSSFSFDHTVKDKLYSSNAINELNTLQEIAKDDYNVTSTISTNVTQIERKHDNNGVNDQDRLLSEESEAYRWLNIDGESYEYQSTIKISLLPSRVQIYHYIE